MPTRNEIQRVRALRHRADRVAQGRFLVQGPKLVGELLRTELVVECIYAHADVAAGIHHPALEVVPEATMERMGTLDSGNVLVAVVKLPAPSPFLPPGPGALVLALDGVSDPGNLGTVLRVAEWFGVESVVCSADCADPYGPKVVQASMGSLFRMKVVHADLPEAVRQCITNGVHVHLAEMEGEGLYTTALQRPAMVVLGSESHGISGAVRAAGGNPLTIPRVGGAESLNVAMAAACICSEFARRTALDQAG